MKKKTCILSLIVSLLFIGSLAQAAERLDLATTYSGQNLHARTVRDFAKQVEAVTGGEITVEVHEGGAMGLKDEDHFTAVADGIVPVASVLMGAAVGTSPIYALSTAPFFVKGFAEARLLRDIARPYYKEEAKKFNQKILYTVPWPPSAIHAKREIKTYDDLKGLKIRTYDKKGTQVLQKAGANAVVMSWGDVYPALATGTIDSVLTSTTSAVAGKFWEVLTDTTLVNFAIPLNMININLDTFNSLSEEQQQALVELGREMEKKWWNEAERTMDKEIEILRENGMEVHEDVSEELAAKLKESGEFIIEDWLEKVGSDGREIIDEFNTRKKQL
ncbi:MAG: TRAP transporter substrate-binding protein [Desulfohalobiaceae bacterium]|nr:TRAP transporter substrate-binding protein [Desulfohalobiaceae bacterium]